MNFAEIFKIGIPLVIGWGVVHFLSAKRDKDKARKEMITKAADSLVDSATQVFATAQRYHTNERKVEDEQRLKIELQDMSIRTLQLSSVIDTQSNIKLCSTSIADLRRAITGRHFDDEHEVALDVSAPQISEIADAYLRVKRAFFSLKISQFPK